MSTAPEISPPWSQEAEESVLGAVLLRAASLDEVALILEPEDFYRTSHGHIFKVMLWLYRNNRPVDLVTVTELLRDQGKLAEVGGPVFLAGLSEHVGTAANAPYYARLVHQKARLRKLLTASQEITQGCFGPVLAENVDAFLDEAEEKIFAIKEDQAGQVVFTLDELVPDEVSRIESNFEKKKEVLGITSGFVDLDKLTGGFQDADLILIAARPSMGKTALGLNIGFHAARSKVPTLFFSLEQPKEQLVQRLMASAGHINAWRLRTARLEQDDWDKLLDISAVVNGPLYIVDRPALTPMEIRARARRLKNKHGIGLVVLDYLQLMREPKAKSREQEVGGISRALKALAKELSVPIIALSQLNRDLEKRPNKKPVLSDLRESGSLEQDADLVLFIYRDEVYNENTKDKGLAEIHLAKQRNGPTGRINLAYRKEFMQFASYIPEV